MHAARGPRSVVRLRPPISDDPPSTDSRSVQEGLFYPSSFHSEGLSIPYDTRDSPQMVRHKKDNFSSRGKKFNSAPRPRPRPVPRDGDGDGDNETGASSRPPFRAACWDFGHCDPKKCSGKRLMQFGLMRELQIGQRYPGVVIS